MNGRRTAFWGAWLALAGTVLSGPVGLALVALTHPQPPWSGPEAFAAAYHPTQALPYAAGFLLVLGFVALLAGLHAMADRALRGRTAAALALGGAFAAMIVTNYVLQTTVVSTLLAHGGTIELDLAGWLTMGNPQSLGWGLEMWGYALLGLATWGVAPVLAGPGSAKAARLLFVANGPVSLAGGVLTTVTDALYWGEREMERHPVHQPQSALSVSSGSSRVARRAGIQQAAAPARVRSTDAAAKIAGSVGVTP